MLLGSVLRAYWRQRARGKHAASVAALAQRQAAGECDCAARMRRLEDRQAVILAAMDELADDAPASASAADATTVPVLRLIRSPQKRAG